MIRKILLSLLLSLLALKAFALAETVRMTVGQTRTLAPSELPSKVLAGQSSWTSSRPSDVEIVSTDMYTCTIKAKRSFSGYALVHCLYYYRELDPVTHQYIYQRSGYKDYHVFVEDDGSGGDDGGGTTDPEGQPTSVTLSPGSLTMDTGEAYRLSVSVNPYYADQTIRWSSSSPAVADVYSNNTVIARSPGSTVITATAVNGRFASCYVTVRGKNPESISIARSGEVKIGGQVKLAVVLEPEGAVSSLTWTSDNPEVASVSSEGIVTGISPGIADITVSTSNGLSDVCSITVTGNSSSEDKEAARMKRAKAMMDATWFSTVSSLWLIDEQ